MGSYLQVAGSRLGSVTGWGVCWAQALPDKSWFRSWITPHRIEKIHGYYEKYGIFTFIVGCFIPGGVRNALFLSSGLGKMPFRTFIFRDGVGCFLSCSTLFVVGFSFAESSEFLQNFSQSYHTASMGVLVALIAATLLFFYFRQKSI